MTPAGIFFIFILYFFILFVIMWKHEQREHDWKREDQNFARDTMHYDLLKDQISTGQGYLDSNYMEYPRNPSKIKLLKRMR